MTDQDKMTQLCQQLRATSLADRLLRAWLRHQIRTLAATRTCWCAVCSNGVQS